MGSGFLRMSKGVSLSVLLWRAFCWASLAWLVGLIMKKEVGTTVMRASVLMIFLLVWSNGILAHALHVGSRKTPYVSAMPQFAILSHHLNLTHSQNGHLSAKKPITIKPLHSGAAHLCEETEIGYMA